MSLNIYWPQRSVGRSGSWELAPLAECSHDWLG